MLLPTNHPFYVDLFANWVTDKNGTPYTYNFATERIPHNGEPRYRITEGPRKGKRAIYKANTNQEISQGYKTRILHYHTKHETEVNVRLDRLTARAFTNHITRDIYSRYTKEWIFTQSQENDLVSFVTFDLDLHDHDDIHKFNAQIALCLDIEHKYGFKGVWTTSPGDYYNNQLVQGRYWTIKLDTPAFVFELREIFQAFADHFGLGEFSWCDKHRNYRIPFQHRVHICTPTTGEYLFKQGHDFDPQQTRDVFTKEINCWADTPVWNNWRNHISDWMKPNENVEQSITINSTSPVCISVSCSHSELTDIDHQIIDALPEDSRLLLADDLTDVFLACQSIKFHARIARAYKWDSSRLSDMVGSAHRIWIHLRPHSTKDEKWHKPHLETLLENKKPRAIDKLPDTDMLICLRSVVHELQETELEAFIQFAGLIDKWDGRVAADILYRNKDALFNKRFWLKLKKKLINCGLIEITEEYKEPWRGGECTKYALSQSVLNRFLQTHSSIYTL